eukprot:4378126-Pleurochrysis_carterae.AAC.1
MPAAGRAAAAAAAAALCAGYACGRSTLLPFVDLEALRSGNYSGFGTAHMARQIQGARQQGTAQGASR